MKTDLKSGVEPKVHTEAESFSIDVKRFHLPGIRVTAKCPECGQESEEDFGDNYLSYPNAGEPFRHHFYCEGPEGKDDHEFFVDLILKVSVELAAPGTLEPKSEE